MRGARRILIGSLAVFAGVAALLPSERDDLLRETGTAATIESAEPAATRPGSAASWHAAVSAPTLDSTPTSHRDAATSSGRGARHAAPSGQAEKRSPRPAPAEDPRRMGHAESSSSWPALDPPVFVSDRLTARIRGHDPIGGRTVLLWRRGLHDTLLLQRTRSDPDGHFDFGELPVPNGDYALVVTSETGDPLSASPTDATRPDLPPPGFGSAFDAASVRIDLHPAVLAGELWVMDDEAVVWRRIAVGRDASVVEIAGEDLARSHSVVQVLPDGRRSTTTPIHIAATAR